MITKIVLTSRAMMMILLIFSSYRVALACHRPKTLEELVTEADEKVIDGEFITAVVSCYRPHFGSPLFDSGPPAFQSRYLFEFLMAVNQCVPGAAQPASYFQDLDKIGEAYFAWYEALSVSDRNQVFQSHTNWPSAVLYTLAANLETEGRLDDLLDLFELHSAADDGDYLSPRIFKLWATALRRDPQHRNVVLPMSSIQQAASGAGDYACRCQAFKNALELHKAEWHGNDDMREIETRWAPIHTACVNGGGQ